MSKEEYLKGENKDKALDIIRYGLATRCNNKEIIDLLKSKGINIAERTLRRFKNELYENSGDSAKDIFQKNVASFLLDDILSFNEMERQCWKIFNSSTDNNEKIKAISTLRAVSAEKLRILKSYPTHGLTSWSQCGDLLPKVYSKDTSQYKSAIGLDYMAKNTDVI